MCILCLSSDTSLGCILFSGVSYNLENNVYLFFSGGKSFYECVEIFFILFMPVHHCQMQCDKDMLAYGDFMMNTVYMCPCPDLNN